MKAKKKTIYEIELSEDQASFIKRLIQNPIGNPDEENIEIQTLRTEIWEILTEVPL